MKRKRRSTDEQQSIVASEVPADEKLASMESINEFENRLVDDADQEEIEDVERDYQGRSTNSEDGVIPMEPSDQKSLPRDEARKPNRPPRHNI